MTTPTRTGSASAGIPAAPMWRARDNWGWTIALRAKVVERDGERVFEGIGTLTNTLGL